MATVTKATRWVALAAMFWLQGATAASAAETIKVGILHSLSGTMAISETSLKDVALMTIEEINAKGGVLGRKLEPVVVDPASNWPLFAEKARELIQKHKVAVTFGCWTSVSRKSVLPVFEELNGLLFYPVQYEGEESSYNVFYTGAAPNQQAIPAVEYLMSEEGGGAKRWVLLGTDYVYPRTTNKILRYFLHVEGRRRRRTSWRSTRRSVTATTRPSSPNVKKFAAGKPDRGGLDDQRRLERAVLQGARQPGPQGRGHPGRRVLGRRGRAARHRHQAARRSPGGLELLHVDRQPDEQGVHRRSGRPTSKKNNLPDGDKRVTNDPMEATYIGIQMWAQAVEQAGTTDVDAVRQAVGGPDGQGAVRLRDQDGRQEPPPAQAGRDRRGHRPTVSSRSSGRPKGPVRAQAVEPVHSRQREEGRRLDLSRGCAATARSRSSSTAATR